MSCFHLSSFCSISFFGLQIWPSLTHKFKNKSALQGFCDNASVKLPWHEIFTSRFFAYFDTSGALIRCRNTFLQINSITWKKTILKTPFRKSHCFNVCIQRKIDSCGVCIHRKCEFKLDFRGKFEFICKIIFQEQIRTLNARNLAKNVEVKNLVSGSL